MAMSIAAGLSGLAGVAGTSSAFSSRARLQNNSGAPNSQEISSGGWGSMTERGNKTVVERTREELDITDGRGCRFSPVFDGTTLVRFRCDDCGHTYCRGQKRRMGEHRMGHDVERKMKERGLS